MNIKQKLQDMASWSLKQYDDSGSHIQNHFLKEDLSTTIKKLYEKKISQEEKPEKTFSFFLNETDVENVIHEILTNPLIQERINFWISDKHYENQTRMIIVYPTEKCIGYAYTVKKEGFQITKTEECHYISVVFCHQIEDNEKPILYTAYPQAAEKPSLILL